MKVNKWVATTVLVSITSAVAASFAVYALLDSRFDSASQTNSSASNSYYQAPVRSARSMSSPPADATQFVDAASIGRPAVVFISAVTPGGKYYDPFFDFFGRMGPSTSTGSGVIINKSGFIVTNYHVIKDATKLEIVLSDSKRKFTAAVVGVEPSADLAVLKIDADNLPFLNFGNSDNLQIGEWVLAVGNPFNLTSTVTAGIVSAKGRDIDIVENEFPIESFIQTDAAINPGNSGGALIDTKGNLVGINTAIYSKTGSYSGYGFAIPSNVVKKMVGDIIEFGYVQRAFIEAEFRDFDDALFKSLPKNAPAGAYLEKVYGKGNASEAGLQEGDIVVAVKGAPVDAYAALEEQLAYYRPGDKVDLKIWRKGSYMDKTIVLTNINGTTSLEKATSIKSSILGAELSVLSKIEKGKYGVDGGIRINRIVDPRGRIGQMGLPEGFIILKLNGVSYADPQKFAEDLEKATGRISILGVNPNGSQATYSFYKY